MGKLNANNKIYLKKLVQNCPKLLWASFGLGKLTLKNVVSFLCVGGNLNMQIHIQIN
jgi:hypothetical protein